MRWFCLVSFCTAATCCYDDCCAAQRPCGIPGTLFASISGGTQQQQQEEPHYHCTAQIHRCMHSACILTSSELQAPGQVTCSSL
jgi:hypothetical protein